MPAKHIEVKTFKLAHSTSDTVRIEHIEKPYGEYSSPVVSIAIYSGGKTKASEVEIPYENIEEFLKALNESIALCESIPRSAIHGELNAEVGGGA
jgi:single-stranded DNA-specific DHH superfamily exonuclease